MMGKLLKLTLGSIAASLLIVVIMLGAFQTSWVKDKLRKKIFEMASEQGYTLSAGAIQGDLPFKWRVQDVLLKLNETDSLKIDTLSVRFSILPLLRKQITISYFYIDNAEISFEKKEKWLESFPSFPWSFSIKSARINHLLLHDVKSGMSMEYACLGKAYFKKKGKTFSIEGTLDSSELTLSSHIEGNKKTDTLSGFLKADVKSAQAFTPFYTFPDETSFVLNTSFEGPWESWKSLLHAHKSKSGLPIKALIKTEVYHLKIPSGRDLSGSCESWLSFFPNHALDIHHFSLKSDFVCLKGEGSFDQNFYPRNFSCSFLLPHLSYLSSPLAGILTGEASYTPAGLSCLFESDELKIASVAYEQPKGKLQAFLKEGLWDGSLTFEAPHEMVPLDLKALFSFSQDNLFEIRDFSLKVANSEVAGDVIFSFPTRTLDGAFFARSADLSPLSLFYPESQLKGSLASMLSFNGLNASFYGLSQNLQWYDLLSHQITLTGSATDLFEQPVGEIKLEGQTTYFKQFLFNQFVVSTHLKEERSTFDASAKGEWKDPFDCSLSGSFSLSKPTYDLQFDVLKGSILKKPFEIQKPFSIQLTDKALVMSEFDLKFKEGYFLASMDLNPVISKIRVKAEHFPIDLLALSTSRFTLKGNSSIDIVIDGSKDNLQGRANILLENADILQSGKKVPIHSKGSLQINLDQNIVQIHGNFKASGQQFFEITASAPATYNFYPLRFGIDRKKPLWAELTMEGHLEEIFDFINIGSHSTTGLLSSHLLLSNNLNDPLLQGTLEIQNGSYENYFTGMVLKEIYAEGKAEKGSLKLTSIKAKDKEKGTLTGSGTVTFAEKTPFSFDFNIENLTVLHINWLSGLFSGPVTISGNSEKALAKGELLLVKADIEIPDELPLDLPVLPFEYINKPPHVSKMNLSPKADYPFHYDLILHAPQHIFLSGRGLNAELEGNLSLKGKNLSLEGEGSLNVIKGTFSFSGKEFVLTQGALSFVNTPSPHAYLNLSGTLSLPEMTVTALLRGPLTAPILTLQSSPTMPTSSILARILFNKDISELSALQAAQLAYSIVSLSGNSGPNVFEIIRKSLGVDRLNISSPSGDSDQFTVQIGKYLTKGVMITLSQSTETSQVIVEVALKKGFILQAETQENEQAKFSLKWNKNY